LTEVCISPQGDFSRYNEEVTKCGKKQDGVSDFGSNPYIIRRTFLPKPFGWFLAI
jgi:hypothetical protein